MREIRVRVAPSPTGDPHVGTAYIALFNYAFAKKMGGRFVLRIEDTDRQRSTRESETAILAALRWLGLSWDEGPDVGGACGPYRQSERSPIYREHAQRLLDTRHAYRCFCSAERLTALREEQQRNKEPHPGYDGHCRALQPSDVQRRLAAGESHVVRLRVPEGETVVADRRRGEIVFQNVQIDDQVILKSDGFPTYHLANVVDDHLMGISHVIRGEEWIPSTPKHLLLYRAFDWEPPQFVHLPLLRNPDKSKLSKRRNPVSIDYYRQIGVLPQALINFLGMMSYSMPDEREQFSLVELIDEFDIDRIKLTGPVFGVDKLTWLNGLHIRDLSHAELRDAIAGLLYDRETMTRMMPLLQERMSLLTDFHGMTAFFHGADLSYDAALLVPKKRERHEMRALFVTLSARFDALREWNAAAIDGVLQSVSDEGFKARDVFMPVRIAVTGTKASPPLLETMELLGANLCRQRIRQAATLLQE